MDYRGSIRFAYRPNSHQQLLSKRRTWFADGDATTDATATDTTAVDDKGKGGASTNTLTQEKVNELVGKARLEGKGSALIEWAKELGFEKPEDIKTLIDAKKAADEAAMSEKDKLEKALADARKEAEDAKAARAELEKQRLLDKRDSRIKDVLKDSRNPNHVLVLMSAERPDVVNAVMKDDGTFDEKALSTLVTTAKQEYKYLFGGAGPGIPSNAGGRNPDPDTSTDAAKQRAFRRARRDV